MSFLNIGSGSGYFNCLVANVMGLHRKVINHGNEKNANYKFMMNPFEYQGLILIFKWWNMLSIVLNVG